MNVKYIYQQKISNNINIHLKFIHTHQLEIFEYYIMSK